MERERSALRERQDFGREEREPAVLDDLVAEDPEIPDVDAGVTADRSRQGVAEVREQGPREHEGDTHVPEQRSGV